MHVQEMRRAVNATQKLADGTDTPESFRRVPRKHLTTAELPVSGKLKVAPRSALQMRSTSSPCEMTYFGCPSLGF